MPAPAARSSSKSTARLFAPACLAVAGLVLGMSGCKRDVESADAEVAKTVAAPRSERGDEAIKAYQKAAKQPNASPRATIEATSGISSFAFDVSAPSPDRSA